MPTSSEAVVGAYEPILVPDQDYHRLERQGEGEGEDKVPETVHADIEEIPEVPSVENPVTNTSWVTTALVVGGVLVLVAAAGVLPAVIMSQVLGTTSSNSSNSNSSTTSSVSVNNTTSSPTNSSFNSSTNANSTTTVCPTNVCTYSTSYSLSTGYYGYVHLDINCTQTLSNFTGYIYVRRTVGASYGNQYHTFWSGTMTQAYQNGTSLITYSWISIANQTISSSGFPYYIEAQFYLQGTNQTVANDTYTVTTQSACNGQVLTSSGHF